MSSSASASASASSATASDNLSNVLGSISQSSTASASASASGSSSKSASASASSSASSSASASVSASSSATVTSASGSNTITDAPSLSTTTAASGSISHLSDLPTLSGYYSYPAPTVPPTQNAPYLQKNSLPENFVFIIVGAFIAFVAVVLIAWRILTSWSINRRFRRHDIGDTHGGIKASYAPLPDFKKKPVPASNYDMKDLGHLPKNFSSVPSLFFSPTAEVARHSTRLPSGGRQEGYGHLPAGHYRDGSRI